MQVTMTVNGETVTREVEGRLLLVHFLRDQLGLTGTHWGCDTSNCGACAVWLDGEPVKSCTVLAAMAGGHEVRTVEGLEQFGELDAVQQRLHGVPRAAVRLLYAGHADDGPRPARPQPGPVRAGDPRGDLRPGLPVHRLRHDRAVGPVGRRRRGGHPYVDIVERPPGRPPTSTTAVVDNNQTRSGTGGCCARRTRGSSGAGAASSTTSSCPACCTWRSCARRWRTRASLGSTSRAAAGASQGEAGRHRRDAGRARPGLDADAVRRRAGGAGHRQGPLPGPGGRVRRRRGPVRRPRRAGAHRRRVRAAAARGRRPHRARPGRAGDPRRPAGKTDNHCFDWETGDAAATDAVFARADVVVGQDMVYPRVHPAPLETCGAVADYDPVDGGLTIWSTTQAPHAHRTLFAMVAGMPEHQIRVISPDIGGGFGNKVPIYPGYLCAIVASLVHRPAGQVDGGPLGEPHQHAFARDYVMRGEIAATRDGTDPRPCAPTCSPTTARSTGSAAPTKYPAGFFGVFTGSYDIEAAHCHDDRGVHQQGAGRRRVLLLVPDHRGRVPGRAARRLPRGRAGDGPGRAAPAQPAATRAVPLHQQDRVGLRLGRLRADPGRGAAHRRLRRAARASRPSAGPGAS